MNRHVEIHKYMFPIDSIIAKYDRKFEHIFDSSGHLKGVGGSVINDLYSNMKTYEQALQYEIYCTIDRYVHIYWDVCKIHSLKNPSELNRIIRRFKEMFRMRNNMDDELIDFCLDIEDTFKDIKKIKYDGCHKPHKRETYILVFVVLKSEVTLVYNLINIRDNWLHLEFLKVK